MTSKVQKRAASESLIFLAFAGGIQRSTSLKVDQLDRETLPGIGAFPCLMLREAALQVIGRSDIPVPISTEKYVCVGERHPLIVPKSPMACHPKCDPPQGRCAPMQEGEKAALSRGLELLDGGRYRT